MKKHHSTGRIKQTHGRPNVPGVKVKPKKKRISFTWKDILLFIFCFIIFVAMVLFIYEHVKLLFK
ncbi:MAG: hypothetical protein ABS68_09255 [Niastella sp. SCN 39-18]|nr:MAG: hypothetical protein ABS68_09255 [Niastella sp. SCN 39-18]OJW10436.1 MAG: hypothetical protein BGO53_09640 [Sphingobacteriales bacterium 39-19]